MIFCFENDSYHHFISIQCYSLLINIIWCYISGLTSFSLIWIRFDISWPEIEQDWHQLAWDDSGFASVGLRWLRIDISWPDMDQVRHQLAWDDSGLTSVGLRWLRIDISWPEMTQDWHHLVWYDSGLTSFEPRSRLIWFVQLSWNLLWS